MTGLEMFLLGVVAARITPYVYGLAVLSVTMIGLFLWDLVKWARGVKP